MTEVTTELQRGAELAGYRIEALLGRGGMGVVYLAEQLRLKRRVALKLLAPELAVDERFRERFLRESELAASLDHPNIVPIFDAGEAEGLLYIAMRYVEGTDLGTLLAAEGRLEPERAVAIIGSVAGALDAAHARGLVHRDVKPANVLLAADGHVYLADFGLTRSAQEGSPEEKPHLSGTLEYVAPEQIEGQPPDPSADLYALGCVLYHTLAGQPPFAKRTQMELLWAHFNEPPPSLHEARPELPEAIDAVIATALAKDPEERYPTCGELAAAAADALGVGLPQPRISRRKLLLLTAGGALTVAAATGVPAILLTRRSTDDTPKPTTVITRDTLQRIDPVTSKLVASIPFGQPGSKAYSRGDLAVGEGAAWVIDRRARTVNRIDASTNTVSSTAAFSVPNPNLSYAAIGVGLGWVWIAAAGTAVVRIDPRTGIAAGEIRIQSATHLWLGSVGLGAVWVLDDDSSVWRIDPRTREATSAGGWDAEGAFSFVPQPSVPAGGLWWWAGCPTDVYELATGQKVATFDHSGCLTWEVFLTEGTESGWVSSPLDDTVWQLDPSTGGKREIHVGKGPRGVASSEGSAWVANSGDGTVSRIDSASGQVVATVPVGGHPSNVALGEGGIWVTTYPA